MIYIFVLHSAGRIFFACFNQPTHWLYQFIRNQEWFFIPEKKIITGAYLLAAKVSVPNGIYFEIDTADIMFDLLLIINPNIIYEKDHFYHCFYYRRNSQR
jgi:hypothetical protein